MSSALQVNFRGVPPSETLVNTVSEHYREFVTEQPALDECLVVIQAMREGDQSIVHALVHLSGENAVEGQQAEAKHTDAHIALHQALRAARERLSLHAQPRSAAWTPWAGVRPNRPLPRAH